MSRVCLVFGLVFVFLLSCCLFGEVSVLAAPVSPPEENVWVEIAPMHHARCDFGTVVVDGKIYVIGGHDERYVQGGIDYEGVIGAVEQYDPQTNTWMDMAPMPTPRYRGVVLCSMGKIYCIGGSSTPQGPALGVNEVYDPATNQWEQKASMPTPRGGVSACVLDGRIYVMGGYIVIYAGVSYPEICEVYDPIEDTWSVYGKPWPEVPSTGMVFDSREYVWDDSKLRIHDLVLDSWMDGPDLPRELYGRGVVEVEGLLYALGGYVARYSFPFYMQIPLHDSVRSCFVYTPFGYGRVAPEVCVFSLEENGVYDFRNVTLEFGLSCPVVWVGYSLDGQANVTASGNTTLSGLSNGRHSVRVFAEDKYGNIGVSETISFSVVNAPLSMLFIATVATIFLVAVVVVCVCLFLFLRKCRHPKPSGSWYQK
ncbi:MAG: hypothetical protein LBI79_10350 [Nitrososphaerota archaeon]|jgi:hypothetical protein|nr:hypothetical protein [Nitrososphaerota archaeon]